MPHKTSYYIYRGCYLCFTISIASICIAVGIFCIYLHHEIQSPSSPRYNRCHVRPSKEFGIRYGRSVSEYGRFRRSVSNNAYCPVAIFGCVWIVVGCVMIMIVLFIFRQTGRVNDEYAERLRRDGNIEIGPEGRDANISATQPVVNNPNRDRVVLPSAPKYGHWVERNDEADSRPGYDVIGSRNSRCSLPNHEEALAMSYVSTSLHI